MTEKRFTLKNWNDYAEGDCIYYDNGEEMGSLDVLDTLNELNDENKELKAKVDDKEVAVEVECEKLMQKVLALIDRKIKEADIRECNCCRNCVADQLLTELKKELQE